MREQDRICLEAEAFLRHIPDLTRPIIHRFFRHNMHVEAKADHSPVTPADRQVETAIRTALAKNFPDHTVIGEEYGGVPDKDFCWVIDPIDGTRSFIIGKPLFGTIIGLFYRTTPLCGLIDMPILGECYRTEAGKTCMQIGADIRHIQARDCQNLCDAHIATTSPDAFDDTGWRRFQHLATMCTSTHFGGDCYNYALLASGFLDIVAEQGLAIHDMAGLVPVLEQAGAIVTNWDGTSPYAHFDGSLLVAATASLHAQALTALQSP